MSPLSLYCDSWFFFSLNSLFCSYICGVCREQYSEWCRGGNHCPTRSHSWIQTPPCKPQQSIHSEWDPTVSCKSFGLWGTVSYVQQKHIYFFVTKPHCWAWHLFCFQTNKNYVVAMSCIAPSGITVRTAEKKNKSAIYCTKFEIIQMLEGQMLWDDFKGVSLCAWSPGV